MVKPPLTTTNPATFCKLTLALLLIAKRLDDTGLHPPNHYVLGRKDVFCSETLESLIMTRANQNGHLKNWIVPPLNDGCDMSYE